MANGFGSHLYNSHRERKAMKSEYDRQRRAKLGDELLAKKRAAYHAAVAANPTEMRDKEREQRKARAGQHAAYCRHPEYKKWKKQYDQKYRAGKWYGDFGEASIVLNELITEINSRVERTEIRRQNGTLNKWIARRRDYERQTDRR